MNNLPAHPQRRLQQSSLRGALRTYRFTVTEPCLTLPTFLDNVRPVLLETVDLLKEQTVKVGSTLVIVMTRMVEEEEREERFYLSLTTTPLSHSFIEEMEGQLTERLETFTQRGSGHVLKSIEALDWSIGECHNVPFLVGHGPVKLPKSLAAKKAVVNVDSPDGECFRYALLSVLHYDHVQAKKRGRASQYDPWLNEHKWEGISFPFTTSQIDHFEGLNLGLFIHLLEWKENKVSIVRRATPPPGPQKIVSILLVEDHFVGVTNLDRLLNSNAAHNHQTRHYCQRCLDPFVTNKKLADHLLFCNQNDLQMIAMPAQKSSASRSSTLPCHLCGHRGNS